MSTGRLSPLQVRVIEILADIEPRWVLAGGAALVGVHLAHRETRDLDLWWSERSALRDIAQRVMERLRDHALQVSPLRTSTSFAELLVSDEVEKLVVDLVADPTAFIETPMTAQIGSAWVDVLTPHESLVSKLCALLGRSELRDLVDVRSLIGGGGDLSRALSDAPRRDGGFSILTLAWVLEGFPVRAIAKASGWSDMDADALDRYRADLVKQLVELARPV